MYFFFFYAFQILAVQEVLANEKAQASNPANEEVDFDDLMDVSPTLLSSLKWSSI